MIKPRIAIIGAGPSGLTAANVFHRAKWPVTVFESDSSADSRDQGGMLDLHPDEGQKALKSIGLLDKFLRIARVDDQDTKLCDGDTGKVTFEEKPGPGQGVRPEIDRIELRKLLLEKLPSDTIKWGTKIDSITTNANGHQINSLNDSIDPSFDLVIGADGAWSRVRQKLSDVNPKYTGVTFMEMWLPDVDNKHPALSELVGHGSLFSFYNRSTLVAQRNGNALVRVYGCIQTDPNEPRTDKTLANMTKSELLEHFKGWSPELLQLISEAEPHLVPQPISALPVDFRWKHQPGLTIVGDAAHVMPPMGAGVNLAMLDASELAQSIVATEGEAWDEAVVKSEKTMMDRANRIAGMTLSGFAEWFQPDPHSINKPEHW